MLSALLTRKGYEVCTAVDGLEALDLVTSLHPDLLISDIKMPRMDGFELFRRVEESCPDVKRILMTGYDIDGYIDMIRMHNVGNILAKSDTLDVREWAQYVDTILSEQVWGLEKVLPGVPVRSCTILTNSDAEESCSEVVREYRGEDRLHFEMALNELVSNAIFHGALQLTEASRDTWSGDFSLTADQGVRLSWAGDSDKIGVSVEDPSGKLRKTDVLRWLDHPIEEETPGRDEHGRGFMLVRRFIDRFIINIDRDKRTECIIVQRFDRSARTRHKPLLIHEV